MYSFMRTKQQNYREDQPNTLTNAASAVLVCLTCVPPNDWAHIHQENSLGDIGPTSVFLVYFSSFDE